MSAQCNWDSRFDIFNKIKFDVAPILIAFLMVSLAVVARILITSMSSVAALLVCGWTI